MKLELAFCPQARCAIAIDLDIDKKKHQDATVGEFTISAGRGSIPFFFFTGPDERASQVETLLSETVFLAAVHFSLNAAKGRQLVQDAELKGRRVV